VVGSLVTALLQMFCWFWQWNKFENRSIYDEIKAYKTKSVSFLDPPVQCAVIAFSTIPPIHVSPT